MPEDDVIYGVTLLDDDVTDRVDDQFNLTFVDSVRTIDRYSDRVSVEYDTNLSSYSYYEYGFLERHPCTHCHNARTNARIYVTIYQT